VPVVPDWVWISMLCRLLASTGSAPHILL
jgi:hypothetical protein